jgi:hypothetical protein
VYRGLFKESLRRILMCKETIYAVTVPFFCCITALCFKKNHLSPEELGQVVKTTIDNKGK